jgi:uncharacterized protein (DUF934 family)
MSMRRIIKDGRIQNDAVIHLADDAAVPAQGVLTVSLARWRKDKSLLAPLGDRVGVRIPNTEDMDGLKDELSGLKLIVLEFPKFGDGRAMSQAHVLRTHHGYRGELRATGDVLRDQMLYMRRCGFDTFEVRPDRSLEDALKAFSEYSIVYQAATDTDTSIFQRRRQARNA